MYTVAVFSVPTYGIDPQDVSFKVLRTIFVFLVWALLFLHFSIYHHHFSFRILATVRLSVKPQTLVCECNHAKL